MYKGTREEGIPETSGLSPRLSLSFGPGKTRDSVEVETSIVSDTTRVAVDPGPDKRVFVRRGVGESRHGPCTSQVE